MQNFIPFELNQNHHNWAVQVVQLFTEMNCTFMGRDLSIICLICPKDRPNIKKYTYSNVLIFYC